MVCLRAGSSAAEWLAEAPEEGYVQFYLQRNPGSLLRVSVIHGNVETQIFRTASAPKLAAPDRKNGKARLNPATEAGAVSRCSLSRWARFGFQRGCRRRWAGRQGAAFFPEPGCEVSCRL